MICVDRTLRHTFVVGPSVLKPTQDESTTLAPSETTTSDHTDHIELASVVDYGPLDTVVFPSQLSGHK